MQRPHVVCNYNDDNKILISSVAIKRYEDLDNMEREINRILKCEHGRSTSVMWGAAYVQFRCMVVRHLQISSLDDEDDDKEICRIWLPQKLLSVLHWNADEHLLNVSFYWDKNYTYYKDSDKIIETEDNKDCSP